MRFTGKTAIFTGAAGGISRAAAKIMGREGARIVAIDIDVSGLASLAEEIDTEGGEVTTLEIDVMDIGQVHRMRDAVLENYGGIDILINVVGGTSVIQNPERDTDELNVEDWDEIIRFNLRGTFLCTNAVIPQMKLQGAGKIINLSSTLGYGAIDSTNSAYVAAKAGIMSFTKKVAREVGPYGITCNAVAPSLTLTERTEGQFMSMSEEARRQFLKSYPLRRVSYPEDQAKVIAFLASSDADFISGQTINVNGARY